MASGGGAGITRLQQPLTTQAQAELQRTVRANPTAIGLALVIANQCGSQPHQKPLAGVEKDYDRMKETFTKLRYAIYGRKDASREELLAMLEAVATFRFAPEYPYKRIVFVFSGHGGLVWFPDGQKSDNVCTHTGDVPIAEIVARLQPCRAPNLEKLPKLFFIDACRGDLKMQGVMVPRGGEDVATKIVAPYGNCLVAYSTMRSFRAYESADGGGVWINVLAQKLLEVRKSIGDVLVEVNRELDSLYQSAHLKNFLQQPICKTTLKEPVNFLAEADPSADEQILADRPPPTHSLLEGCSSPVGALRPKPDHSQESMLPAGGTPSQGSLAPRPLHSSSSQGGLQNVNRHTVCDDSPQAVDYTRPDARPAQPIPWQYIQSPMPNAAPTKVVDQSPPLYGPPKRSYSTDEDGASSSAKVTSWHEKKSHSTDEGLLFNHYRSQQSSGPLGLQCVSTGSHASGSVQHHLGLSTSVSDPGPSHSEHLLEKYKRDKWIQSYQCTVQSVEDRSRPELSLFKATVTLSLPGNTELELCGEGTAPYSAREKATEKAVQVIEESVGSADKVELDHEMVPEAAHAGRTEETVAAQEQNDHSPPQGRCKIVNYRTQFNEWCQQNGIVPKKDYKDDKMPTLGQHQNTITYTMNGQVQSFVSGYHSRKKDAEEEASSRALEHERLKRICDSLGKTPKTLLKEYCDKSRLPGFDFRPVPQSLGFQFEVVMKGTSNEAVAGDVFQSKGLAEHSAALRALHKYGIL